MEELEFRPRQPGSSLSYTTFLGTTKTICSCVKPASCLLYLLCRDRSTSCLWFQSSKCQQLVFAFFPMWDGWSWACRKEAGPRLLQIHICLPPILTCLKTGNHRHAFVGGSCMLNHVPSSLTPWTIARQAPLGENSMNMEARILEWVAISSSQGSNLHLLQWQADSLPRSHLWSPTYTVLDTEMKDVHSSLTPKINSHFTLHCSQSCALLSYLLNPIPLFSCWICYDKITKISPNDLSMTATNSVDLTELREFSLLTESNDSWAGHTPLHGSGSNRDSFSSGLFNVHL